MTTTSFLPEHLYVPLRTLLGLIFCNLIWSAHPLMGKLVLADFRPSEAAWLRYTTAFVVYCVAALFLRAKRPFFFPQGRGEWGLTALMGFMTFCFAPLSQMTGLAASEATDNALIIAMEPLITVFMAWVLLGERLRVFHWIAFGLALAGFLLLAGLSPLQSFRGLDSQFLGNLLILFSLTGEAVYSVFGRKLLLKHPPMAVFGTVLGLGAGFLTLALVIAEGARFPLSLAHRLSWESALGLVWLGPFGTTLAYLFWMIALTRAPVASVALTLFVQPVFGAALGFIFLGERLSWIQAFGGGLILVAVMLQARAEYNR